jgi:hypothetical protein
MDAPSGVRFKWFLSLEKPIFKSRPKGTVVPIPL